MKGKGMFYKGNWALCLVKGALMRRENRMRNKDEDRALIRMKIRGTFEVLNNWGRCALQGLLPRECHTSKLSIGFLKDP